MKLSLEKLDPTVLEKLDPMHALKTRTPWWVKDGLRKIGVFILALIVAFVIMLLVTLPVIALAYWLLKYAAAQ